MLDSRPQNLTPAAFPTIRPLELRAGETCALFWFG
jgi:hypothetical protein